MKLRTKICLLASASLMVLSQCYSVVMLSAAQKQRMEETYSYESDLFSEKISRMSQAVSRSDDWSLTGEMKQRIVVYAVKDIMGLEYAVYLENEPLYNPTPYEFAEPEGEGTVHIANVFHRKTSNYEEKVGGNRLLLQKQTFECKGMEKELTIWRYVDVSHVYEDTQKLFLSGLAAALFLAVLISAVLAAAVHMVMKPLYRLQKTVGQIAGGDYTGRVPRGRKDEIGEISEGFNQMAEKVEEQIDGLSQVNERQQRLLGSLAHELKTPMTAIIGYSDALLKIRMSQEQQEKALNYIGSEGRRLSRLSAKMLELTGLYQEEGQIFRKLILVRQLFDHVKALVSCRLEEKHLILETGIEPEGLELLGDRDLMTSLLMNLVDNACKASEEGGKIRMTADKQGFVVEDWGIGIPKEEISRITEAFYMVDKSRSRALGGSGLGLALCREIAVLHGARLLIESAVGKGTRISVQWEEDVHKLDTTCCGLRKPQSVTMEDGRREALTGEDGTL